MARNKAQKPLTEAPPEADSSEESTSNSSIEPEEEENSGSSSDEEQTPSTPQPPPASGKKAPTSASASAAPTAVASGNKRPLSEDDSSSDDEEDEPTLQKIKPISKPGFISGTLGKDQLKYTIAALPAGQVPEKRSSESALKSSSKKPRKEKSGSVAAISGGAGGGVPEEGSKKLFQRVFSEDDEILILKGMIDFKAKRGADPMIEIDDFYGFIKKSLHVEVSKVQIVDKVRRLKKKFFNAKKKKLTNPVEIQCFELSKKIWENNYSNAGDDVVVEDDKGTNGAVAENNGNSNVGLKSKARVLKIKSGSNAGAVGEDQKKKNDKEEELIEKSGKVVGTDEKDLELEVGEAVAWEELRKKGLRMMGAKARAEIGEMWEKVAMKQAEARILRSEAEQEETRRIMEALRSGKH
ncbi:GLABROUS1 enhancer-binding protein-like [Chenopodium quinoa]|uniref:Glabrous enhancer-binding protein-like DBD domain-containing protein n=1 Tax=Chenopodium quinoa TaxID=63459 RepID=A0A803LKX3_CHEQI|nr:GLABROUS1 enhancer-binding protein-like [Chenopodium quinoa]